MRCHNRTSIAAVIIMFSSAMTWAQTTLVAPLNQEQGGKIVEGYQLVAEPKESTFGSDQPVLLYVTARDQGDSPLYLTEADAVAKEFKFTVTDAQGHLVPPTRFGKRLFNALSPQDYTTLTSTTLKKGQEARYLFWLNSLFDMSINGTYHVKVSRVFPDATGKQEITLVSNMTEVQVGVPRTMSSTLQQSFSGPTIRNTTN